MKPRHKVKISIGATTILMIFVVLCFTTFAVLSFLTARSDFKLTTKSVVATKEYYQADGKVEEWLAFTDEFLQLAFESATTYVQNGMFTNLPLGEIPQEVEDSVKPILASTSLTNEDKVNDVYQQFADLAVQKYPGMAVKLQSQNTRTFQYVVKVNENYQIQVKLLLNHCNDEKRYQIQTRKLVSTKQWEQEQVEVWNE